MNRPQHLPLGPRGAPAPERPPWAAPLRRRPDDGASVSPELSASFQRALSQVDAVPVTPTNGRRIARLYSAAVEGMLRQLAAGIARTGWALVSSGSQARRERCPHSDVDLLLIHSDASAVEELVRELIYPLWDLGLKPGYRLVSLEDFDPSSLSGLQERTSLLDLRFLAGDMSLYADARARLVAALEGWRTHFLRDALAENRRRLQRRGTSVYLLEPHVKEGKGGLRDLHWMRWLARVVLGQANLSELLLFEALTPAAYSEVSDALNFLLAVRIALHRQERRSSDRLLFPLREPIARALGFTASGRKTAEECFLSAYYTHASRLAGHAALFARRMLGAWWDEPSDAPEMPLVELREGTRPGPGAALGLLVVARTLRGRVAHESLEQLRAALLRSRSRGIPPRQAERFRLLLRGPHLDRLFTDAHLMGLLPALLHEYGALVGRVQHSRIHRYTVDVHSIQAIRRLGWLSQAEATAALVEGLCPEAREVLSLATLLHDVGKGSVGRGHARVGADIALAIASRLGFPEAAALRVRDLVLHHLLLSRLALRRDIDDPATIEQLNVAVQRDREMLDQLYLLTLADTWATNPELLTPWKLELLTRLHRRCREALSGSRAPDRQVDLDERLRQLGELLAQELPRPAARRALELVREGSAPDVLLAESLSDSLARALLLYAFDQSFTPQISYRPMAHLGLAQIICCAADRAGLFSEICGCLAAWGLSITSASAITRVDDIALDVFHVTPHDNRPLPGNRRWARIERSLSAVLSFQQDAGTILADRGVALSPRRGSGLPEPAVRWVDDATPDATVLDITLPDRVGLLHEVSRALHEAGLVVTRAHIHTEGDRARESFYLVDSAGQPLAPDAPIRAHLRSALLKL